jgi:hypothetical protein
MTAPGAETGAGRLGDREIQICDVCGMVVAADDGVRDAVPDSSAVDLAHPELDGWRPVVACGSDHLEELRREYAARPFDYEELWAQIVDRAERREARWCMGIDDLVASTGLTIDQLLRAIRWRAIWHKWV